MERKLDPLRLERSRSTRRQEVDLDAISQGSLGSSEPRHRVVQGGSKVLITVAEQTERHRLNVHNAKALRCHTDSPWLVVACALSQARRSRPQACRRGTAPTTPPRTHPSPERGRRAGAGLPIRRLQRPTCRAIPANQSDLPLGREPTPSRAIRRRPTRCSPTT